MKNVLIALAILVAGSASAQKKFTLSSPDGKLAADIAVGGEITYSVSHEGDVMLAPSTIAMQLDGTASFGIEPRLSGSSVRSVDEVFDAPVYKRAKVADRFNELTLRFRGDYDLVFRAYDDGIAYRFVYRGRKPFRVIGECAEFVFPDDAVSVFSYVKGSEGATIEQQLQNSFENICTAAPLSAWDAERLAFLPVVVEGPDGKKVCITEAGLIDYPGMFLRNTDSSQTLRGHYAPYPKSTEQGGYHNFQMVVTSREDYIARVDGPSAFPWRVVIVSENDVELADSDMVYKLSDAPQGDFSWVRPGKVAWEWWNGWNLYGVDFETGVNNDTYKYYIDFAADNGIEYIILDEGWAVNNEADLMRVVPGLDLEEIVAYGRSRGVGIILWAGYWAFHRDMENVCRHYADMGIKGFKVDFMERDDQPMVEFHRLAAETAARYGLMLDMHGTYKPTGLHRTYPNVVNYEGVNGLEQMKWDGTVDQVTYDVTIPFVRQVAGPLDYTQGAMRNAAKGNFRPVNSEPMSQGTRCRQLAQYVVFESPLNMLCDSPSNYMKEPECTGFIAGVPTVWDETVALNGRLGKYVTIARRSGDVWYVGAMTGWDARNLELDLSFLGEGDFVAELFSDGVNAAKVARDYRREVADIPADRKLVIRMSPGGGFAAKIVRKR